MTILGLTYHLIRRALALFQKGNLTTPNLFLYIPLYLRPCLLTGYLPFSLAFRRQFSIVVKNPLFDSLAFFHYTIGITLQRRLKMTELEALKRKAKELGIKIPKGYIKAAKGIDRSRQIFKEAGFSPSKEYMKAKYGK
jgi:hypothetical protein